MHHDISLHKLCTIGLSEIGLSWFKSYLTCTNRVRYNNLFSKDIGIMSGIGQGTILGPFYLFYI